MKNIIMTGVMAVALFAVTESQAQTKKAVKANNVKMSAQMQTEYKEVSENNLPEAVKKSLKSNFEEAKVDKAYVNNENLYKVVLKLEDIDTTKTVYLGKEGEMLRK